jgi:DNA-binding Lrp family transcriptional regulator
MGTADLPSRMSTHRMLTRSTELSDLDRRLIDALQLDGRVSFATLGPQLQSTEKVVRLRTQELREAGLIDITAVTSPELLGYRHAAYVTVEVIGRSRADVAEDISLIPEVDYMATTIGRYSIWAEVLGPSLQALTNTIDTRIAVLPGVSKVAVLPYLSLFHHKPVYAESGEAVEVKSRDVMDSAKDFKLDDVDTQILGHLSTDGRMSFQDIGRHLDVSGDVVRRRVHRMRKAGVVKIMAIANPMGLGFEFVAMVGFTLAPHSVSSRVAELISKTAAVTYTVICSGEFTIFCEVTCVTGSELQSLLDQFRTIEGIATAEAFVYSDIYYRKTLPIVTTAGG